MLGPAVSATANPAFDITPARLVTGIITDRGIVDADAAELARLYPDRAGHVGDAREVSRIGEADDS